MNIVRRLRLALSVVVLTAPLTAAEPPKPKFLTPEELAKISGDPEALAELQHQARKNTDSTEGSRATQSPSERTPLSGGPGGQITFIDAVTGEVRELNLQELRRFHRRREKTKRRNERQTSPSDSQASAATTAAVRVNPDGSITAVVPRELHSNVIARVSDDGSVELNETLGKAESDTEEVK